MTKPNKEFAVPQTEIKQHQQVILELLTEFDRICRKHDIPYLLFAGTMLGAVRHQGFIPWDDDLDVIMLRKDYRRFLTVAPEELTIEKYYLQAEFTEEWPMFFSKLRKNGTACLEKYHPRIPHHQGIYIDIFPCDNAYQNKLLQKMQFFASKLVIARSLGTRGYDTDSLKKKIVIALARHIPMGALLSFCRAEQQEKSSIVHTFFAASSNFQKSVLPRSWFTNTMQVDFETSRFPISREYHTFLTTLYGDYMTLPPEEDRAVKQHAILVDPCHSYEVYEGYRDGITFDIYTRSIR